MVFTLEQVFFILTVAVILAAYCPITYKSGVKTMSNLSLTKLKSAYGTDLTKETEGVWFKSSFMPGLEFLIARNGNPAHEKLVRKLYKPYAKTLRAGRDLPEDVTEEISNELLVETILMDWRGMPSDDGGEIPFSKAVAYQIMQDRSLKELKDEILEFSNDFARYQIEEREETAKN
jgi:hypothetical protein